ncbi:MAG: 50S ribosomal protein L30 [Gaiellales bacterium]
MSVKVTLVKSTIGVRQDHRGTLRALGLRRIGSSKVHQDSPSLRGQLHQVKYLVKVEEV